MELEKSLIINRSTAIALLARLGLSDIPYVQTQRCRDDLINYLSNFIINSTTENYEVTLKIDIDDLKTHIGDHENAIKILTHYTITKY